MIWRRAYIAIIVFAVSVACAAKRPPAYVREATPPPSVPPSAPRSEAISTAAPAPGISPESALPLGQKIALASGASATVVQLPDSTLVAIEWRAPVGSAQDGPLRGASQWIAGCLARRLRFNLPLAREFAAVGAEVRLRSDVEHLVVRVLVPPRHAAAALRLTATLLRAPGAAELIRARPFARKRVGVNVNSLELTARAALLRELFELPTERHPYATQMGPAKLIERASAQLVAALARKQLDPKSARVVVAGAVRAARLGSPARAPSATARAAAVPNPLRPSAPRVSIVDHPGAEHAAGIVGTLGPATLDPRAPLARAAWFAFERMGGTSASWAGKRFESGPELLAWSVSGQPGRVTSWIQAFLSKGRGAPHPWKTIRARASDAQLLRLESALGVASTYGVLLGAAVSPESYDDDRRRARSAPDRALSAALATHLARHTWVVVVAGDAKRLAPALQRYAPVTVLNRKSDFSILRRLPRTQASPTQ